MRELFLLPEIHKYDTVGDFVKGFNLEEKDVIITTRPVIEKIKEEFPANIRIFCYEQYGQGEPTNEMFETIQEEVLAQSFERIIAIGGGSCIDIAKMLCVADGRSLDEVFDTDSSHLRHIKKLIAVPTTCGTGSEVTVTAVFDRKNIGTKMGITNYAFQTDYAVLIPSLLRTLPNEVFANSSIDATIHAIESYLDERQATDTSRIFAERALGMIIPIYRKLEREGIENKTKYLYEVQMASLYAGIAITNALPSVTHAMGYPFADKFHRPHGESCYVFLDVTLRKYLKDVESGRICGRRKEIWKKFMEILAKGMNMEGVSDMKLLQRLDALLNVICPKKSLKEYGATLQDCETFGKSCYARQQRLLQCSFTPFTEQDLIKAYKDVW